MTPERSLANKNSHSKDLLPAFPPTEDDGNESETVKIDPEKVEREYNEDIRCGELDQILFKLEEKGKKHCIHLYKEMAELREMRNKTVQKLLEQYGEDGEEKQIIDSS